MSISDFYADIDKQVHRKMARDRLKHQVVVIVARVIIYSLLLLLCWKLYTGF